MKVTIKFLQKVQIALLILFVFSCSSDQENAPPDTSYFPLAVGSESVFEVERINYSLSETPTNKKINLRQTITNSFTDLNGNLAYKIEFEVNTRQNQWRQDSVSILWRGLDKAYIQENGQTVVKMIFPLADGTAWNGNDYNTLPETIFRCTAKNKPLTIGSIHYPNTVTIIRQDDSTLLSRNKYIEMYAAEIGLISTEKVFVKYCNTPDCIGKGIINSGYKEISVLKTYIKK
ncbi:hypothetical protein [Dyadobacter sp. CY312]|uniref:hypothetical protein n=1 Tax=Dyadobacter sp. CY312 TaxID=2907303 RepID=UPI001F193425|nr:hypothetical protein [Dyadobacter sp. CY312]MCE7039849.1 hypothetical protein [Dyadobacter sp. CY312]